jgi:uncharacterized damage-inducible protein DinB
MSATDLRYVFDLNQRALEANTDGLSAAEARVPPAPGANCMTWVVAHIVAYRDQALERLHARLPDAGAYARFGRGSAPLAPEEAVDWEALLVAAATRHAALDAALEGASEARLAEQDERGRSLADTLRFMQFHESYHVGQAGLLRRVAGHEGAIR